MHNTLSHLLARFTFLRCLALLGLMLGLLTPALAAKTYSDNGDGTVTDPTTGLTWMRCSMGQTWDGTTCTGNATFLSGDKANTIAGSVTYSGKNDWRLPNIRELLTILDRSIAIPLPMLTKAYAINSTAFPNTGTGGFWSSSTYMASNTKGFANWMLSFGWGYMYDGFRVEGFGAQGNVRLVRGGLFSALLSPSRQPIDYVDHRDGTVTHSPSGLMWKRCAEGQSWSSGICSGTTSKLSLPLATGLTSAFANYSDWRLPTIAELESLVDYNAAYPALNSIFFSSEITFKYWSISSASFGAKSWDVDFAYGHASTAPGTEMLNVRLVRGGSASVPLNVSLTGTGLVRSGLSSIECGAICSGDYSPDATVILNAQPIENFLSWGGDCTGIAATCTVTMDAAKSVTATFKDTPVVSGLPSALTFSTQNIGSTSAFQTVTLTNTGTAALAISSITITGDYAVTNNCGSGLGAGGFCTLEVSFKPTASGTRTDMLTLTSDAPGSPYTITLTGTGQGALANLSATSKIFASQNLGTTSTAQTIILSNTGGAVLNISSIVVTGDFAKTTSCSTTLAPSTSCSISVLFAPTAVGPLNGSVIITSDASNSPNTISLSGAGLAVPVVALNPTILSFAATALGSTSAVQTIKLSNTGGAVLSLTSISTTGDFAVANNCGAGLGAGGFCNLSVTFSPTAAGNRVGFVTISDNATGSPHNISVSGIGDGLSQTIGAIGFNPVTLKVAGATALNATATSGLAVTFSSSTPTICSVSGNTVTGLLAGACTVAANQAGNANYSAAPQGTQNITVGKPDLTLSQGWNLMGNGHDQLLNVATVLGDPTKVITVWKWDTLTFSWQFYAPSMTAAALQTYATSKGYGVLSTVNPGEGFWVNAVQPFASNLPIGNAIGITAFQPGQAYALKPAWNLVSIGNALSPSAFNAGLSATPPASGVIAANITTLWAWDNPQAKWYFYAPNLEGQGGTALLDYTAGKGYLDFTTTGKTLGLGAGFWVNKP